VEVTRKLVEALAHTDSEHLPNALERDEIAIEWWAAFERRNGASAGAIRSMRATPEDRASTFAFVERNPIELVDVLFAPAQGYAGWGLRVRVIRALGHIGASAVDALPMLLRECQNRTNVLRFDAAAAAWRIGGPTPEVIATFGDGCRSSDGEMRQIAVSRLRDLGTESPKAVALLSEALQDGSTTVRKQAAESLAWLGTNAISALPALRALENDQAFIVRVFATQAVLAVQFSNTVNKPLECGQNIEAQK
jgi:HEAT repeat protein